MNFVFFLIFAITLFLLSIVGYKKFRATTLYALAIGGAVNANFFHAGYYPINCFGLPFGIDSIIYSLFIFCVMIMFFKANKKEAYILTISSIIAIVFSSCMQLFVDLLTKGSSLEIWTTFFNFAISSIASAIAIWIMLEISQKLQQKKVNQYVILVLGMLIAAIINSSIYYTATTLIHGAPENILQLLLTSFIGKMIALVCSLGTFWLMNKLEKPKLQETTKTEDLDTKKDL